MPSISATLLPSPANLPAEASAPRPTILIVALAARALAAAAVRTGYAPLIADGFGDADTRALAVAFHRVSSDAAGGLDPASCRAALAALRRGRAPPVGLVYGSGFEACPEHLTTLAPSLPLLGNIPAVVRTLKTPVRFAAICARLGISHPAIRQDAAPDAGWLEKQAGAAGGGHIRAIPLGHAPAPGHYLQRRVAGKPISALFLADGQHAMLLFFTAQWSDPVPHAAFRYGGALRPAPLAPTIAAAMTAAVAKLVAATGLVGLNSADFLVREGDFDLLEINPRPGATLDLAPGPVFRWHLAACRGSLPTRPPIFPAAAAAAIVYARQATRLPAAFNWPAWTADRPLAGEYVPAHAPLCTVRAAGRDARRVHARLRARRERILARAEECATMAGPARNAALSRPTRRGSGARRGPP